MDQPCAREARRDVRELRLDAKQAQTGTLRPPVADQQVTTTETVPRPLTGQLAPDPTALEPLAPLDLVVDFDSDLSRETGRVEVWLR